MKYSCSFTGRRVGAIGVMQKFDGVVVEATDEANARLAVYQTHEHLSGFVATLIGDAVPSGFPHADVREWFFTFGVGDVNGKRFVRLSGTVESTRDRMFALFGNKWSMQYPSATAAGVEKYGLTELVVGGGP